MEDLKPIGILPTDYYNKLLLESIEVHGGMSMLMIHKQRLLDIEEAIMRYANENLEIPSEWVDEHNQKSRLIRDNKWW